MSENASLSPDKETIIVSDDNGTSITISVPVLRELLIETFLDNEEKARQLVMMIHEIEKEELAKIGNFMKHMIELDKNMDKALQELEKATSALGVKKWDTVLAAYTKKKNVLAEVRRSIGLIERRKKPLRARIAKLGFDPTEMTGESS